MSLAVELVSPEQVVYTGIAEMVVARTTDGEIAFQPGHMPFLGVLVSGDIRVYTVDGAKTTIAVERGFVEIHHDNVSLLSDTAIVS
ncbi:MAG: F0F1 ATP synthase subunit epsilon [Acidimicrobiia bacterium]|nr:F0F1 ATP synthase subunit epsilon [Acidimicrobiia bacterium]MYC57176.1 F0F1 ATP synthase subunit epsilon [Acidimicrobiia bacterium]MYG93897.1 F0F1 ATP synthase subunit epsilon [Acidimicrobiia bacterium]MYI29900.1 F0F1 ATP synthase subunit epsilon [Acidimicrobiia bacterium]